MRRLLLATRRAPYCYFWEPRIARGEAGEGLFIFDAAEAPDEEKANPLLLDIKEAAASAAPRAAGRPMPEDNAERVVAGARALAPNLGERMVAKRLLGKAVVVRELTPQDIKVKVDRLEEQDAMALAAYLAAVVGRAHARQMDRNTRNGWRNVLARARTSTLEAPTWLWSSIVDLLAIHERAYLQHCRVHALGQNA